MASKSQGMRHLLDSGPLIPALNRHDQYHAWACETLESIGAPFYSCPEVLAEAAAMTGQPAAIVEIVHAGDIILAFNLAEQSASTLALLRKYADHGMDLADACLVRMSELMRDSRVITVDRADFVVYRRNGRELIPLVTPLK
jgi:predicted nucleic acid-binding protein